MSVHIGIIGAGGMAGYHCQGFLSAGAKVTAITDVNPVAAQRAADKLGIARVFSNVEDLLACQEIDAVSIIVPNKFHCPLTLQALQAGKHVFCEKPPALNMRETLDMKTAAEVAGKTLAFNFNNRARPDAQALYQYIQQGRVGTINSVQAKWIRRTGIPGFGGWFTQKKLSGGGPLIDLLHMIDLALYYMGYPAPASVLAQTFNDFIQDKSFKGPWGLPDVEGAQNDVESACHGFVTFVTGQVLSFQISWAEMVKREEVSVTFQGSKAGGMLRRLFGVDGLDDTATDTAELYLQEFGKSVNCEIVAEPDPAMGRTRSAANFVEVLEGKADPLNTPAQAVRLMHIIEGAYTSAATGQPVQL